MLLANGCVSAPKTAFKGNAATVNISRITVADFTDAPGAEAGRSGYVVASSIANEFLKIQGVTVIERDKLKTILNEQRLSSSGLIDDKTATKIGHILGVNGIITGSVSQYNTSTIPIFLGLFTYYKDIYNVAANMRMIDPESGMIVFLGSCSGTSTESYQEASDKVAQAIVERFLQVRKEGANLSNRP